MTSCFLASCGVSEHIYDASKSTQSNERLRYKEGAREQTIRERRIHDSQVQTELKLEFLLLKKEN